MAPESGGSERPDARHEQHGDDEDDDGEGRADAEEIHEAIASWAIDHEAGGFERGEIGAAGGDGDDDGERAGIELELRGGLNGDRQNDRGGGLVGHRLGEGDGEDEESAEHPRRGYIGGQGDELLREIAGGAGADHGFAECEHAGDENDGAPFEFSVGVGGRDAVGEEHGERAEQDGDGESDEFKRSEGERADKDEGGADRTGAIDAGFLDGVEDAHGAIVGETGDGGGVSLEEKHVADVEDGAAEFLEHVSAVSIQRENLKPVAFAETDGAECATGETGARDDERFHERGFFGAEVGVGEFDIGADLDAGGVLDFEDFVAGAADEQDVAVPDGHARARPEVEIRFAEDADDLEVEVAAQIDFGECFSDEGGVGEHEDLGDIGTDAELIEEALRRSAVRDQASADEEHISDTCDRDGNADGRELEHAERLEMGASHETADDEIGRRADEGDGTREDRRKGDRHEEARWRDFRASGDADYNRKKEGCRGGVADESAEGRDRNHDNGEQNIVARAGVAKNGARDELDDAGAHERGGHDQQREDHDDGVTAKTGERVTCRQETSENQREEQTQRDNIGGNPLEGEEDQRDNDQAEQQGDG